MNSIVAYFKNIGLFMPRIWKGQSVARIMLNQSFIGKKLVGRTVDVGGGRSPDYFDYFSKDDKTVVEMIDGSSQKIDFETEKLPFEDASIDTVILNNVLEHIYNHNHLVREIHRILKKDGMFVGFVPFIIQYHPDPHDYFRYTKEALSRIFGDAHFRNVRIQAVGMGPFMANFNSIMLYMPRILRCALFPFYLFVAQATVALSPALKERYPLGFTFLMNK